MIACLAGILLSWGGVGLEPGQEIWVGHGMAKGYGMPFATKLTVVKARELIMKEVRVILSDGKKYYLKADFGDDYAFREDPFQKYPFSEREWEMVQQGVIQVGMRKELFLCIKPRPDEVSQTAHPDGAIECWIYRDEPRDLFGSFEQNPPTSIFYFQNDVLVYSISADGS